MNKKGIQLSEAFGAVLTLVLVALLIVIAIFLFVSIQTSVQKTTAVTVTNETSGYLNQTGYALKNSTLCGFNTPSIVIVYNTSDGALITSGNYTVTSAGLLKNATTTTWSDILVSYSYYWGDSSCTATASMITGFSTYPSLVILVGTIIFLALVIGVLVSSFYFGKKGA